MTNKNNSFAPDWAKDAIYYQIFVDRFYKSTNVKTCLQEGRNYRKWGELPNWKSDEFGEFHNNDFFGGNLKGIEEKLDYLKSLNVDVIYLSPINKSLYRYERYASSDHMEIDPDAGTFNDLDSLHKRANKLGMHIILDIAFNHCNSDNPIFQDALNNPNSKYRDWFYFDYDNNYRYWFNLFKDMPIFNQNNYEYQQYVYGENGVIDKFSKYVDGFRLDLAEELQPFFLEGIRNRANSNGHHVIIGESWQIMNSNIFGKSLDSVTNYFFTNGVFQYVLYGDCECFNYNINIVLDSYPQDTIDTMLNSLDTHDIVRSLTMLGGKNMRRGYDRIWEIDKYPSLWHYDTHAGIRFDTEGFRRFEFENDKLNISNYDYAKKLLKLSSIILYFLPGCPCMYYGTEVGLHGYKDPFNRKCFPWDNMDLDLLNFYRELFKFRTSCKLQKSTFEIISINDRILMFKIHNDKNSILVAVNRTDSNIEINIPEEFINSKSEFSLNATKNCLHSYGGIVILK